MADQADFELRAARLALPSASVKELDRICDDARSGGHAIGAAEETRIARALGRRDVAAARADLPPIPEDLAGYSVSSASGGRRFEIELDVDATNREAVHRARRRYIAELRLVQSYVQKGLSLEAAWAKVRKRLRLDPVRKLPRRLRRKVDTPTVAPREKPAEAPAATVLQPDAPKPTSVAPRWAPGASAPATPAKEPNIPSIIATGIDGKVRWIP